jgi:hypothetical protein
MMRYSLLCGAAMAALALSTVSAKAGLLYSFEAGDVGGPTDGFISNGIAPIPSNAAGTVTNGLRSLELVAPAGFNGALTQTNLPADLANPALSAITMDVTNLVQYGGTFSNIGFDFFVSNPGLGDFGEQWGPPTSAWPTAYFAGQQLGLTIPVEGTGAAGLNSLSFSQLLAAGYSVTGFQILVSNGGGTNPSQTEYVDNIQGVVPAVPEPASLSVLGMAGGLALSRRRRK